MLEHIASLYDNVLSLHLRMQHHYENCDKSMQECDMSMKECDTNIQM